MMVTYDAMRVLREFLLASEPRCGAEIIRALKEAPDPFRSWLKKPTIGAGTLYPMLARLKGAGFIALVASLPAPDAPTAHFYRITPEGRVVFLEKLCRLTIPTTEWNSEEFEQRQSAMGAAP